MNVRVGFGFDVHEFAKDRKLILGGVDIPHTVGLAGHSDADAIVHAVVDALLGAAGLGDIGVHFPNTDPQYKDVDSRFFLRKIAGDLVRLGYSVSNVDITVVAQAPRLSPYISEMKRNIARDLEISKEQVNVKATTTESLGFIGREEGVAVWAVVSMTS